MRPKKIRWVECLPGEKRFRPHCSKTKEMEGVVLHLDEYEVLRLTHLEGCDQGCIAKTMKIHQSTISRILASAHKKMTVALVYNKAVHVKTGCCRVIKDKSCCRKNVPHNAKKCQNTEVVK
jgi:predicted DNA-binding protein (UPF0251 family)